MNYGSAEVWAFILASIIESLSFNSDPKKPLHLKHTLLQIYATIPYFFPCKSGKAFISLIPLNGRSLYYLKFICILSRKKLQDANK